MDTFQLFKEVQRLGGSEAVTRDDKGWMRLAERMGYPTRGLGLQNAFLRYLADFEVCMWYLVQLY